MCHSLISAAVTPGTQYEAAAPPDRLSRTQLLLITRDLADGGGMSGGGGGGETRTATTDAKAGQRVRMCAPSARRTESDTAKMTSAPGKKKPQALGRKNAQGSATHGCVRPVGDTR